MNYRKPFLAMLFVFTAVALAGSPYAALADVRIAESWSADKNLPAGIDEAIEALRKKGIHSPELVVTFFTEQYHPGEILKKLKGAFPKTKIYGQSVYRGVFTSEGLHVSPTGSIALLAFEGNEFRAGVAGAEVPEGSDAKALTVRAAQEAIAEAGQAPGLRPAAILLGARKGSEEESIGGLASVLPKDSPLIGGTPTTNNFGVGAVIANDKVYKHGLTVGVLYSRHKAGASFFSGFVGAQKSGKVTSAKGRLLETIDGKPAQEVFKAWAGGRFDHIKPVDHDIMTMETALAPFAKKIVLADGQERLVAVRPQKFRRDGGLELGANVEVGETLYYVEGTQEALVKRAGVVAKKALVEGGIKMSDIAGGIHIYCAGASTVIGLDKGGKAPEMVQEIVKSMNGKPFIGGFTSAEEGEIPGFGFFHGNLMSSMAVFSR